MMFVTVMTVLVVKNILHKLFSQHQTNINKSTTIYLLLLNTTIIKTHLFSHLSVLFSVSQHCFLFIFTVCQSHLADSAACDAARLLSSSQTIHVMLRRIYIAVVVIKNISFIKIYVKCL